jgi:hypothetical protein
MPETESGCSYILTAVCPFTQWPFAVPIANKEAETVARALVQIFSVTAPPERVVSDRAKEFIGEVMQEVCRILRIHHIKTSGFNPQANGVVERFHRFLMACLTVHVHEFRSTWDDALAPILFAFRASVSTTTGYSPFFLVYGREAPLPLDSLFKLEQEGRPQSVEQYTRRLHQTLQNVYKGVAKAHMAAMEKNRDYRDRKEQRKHVSFTPGDFVLVWGPVAAGAPYPDKKKLLYQWSTPRVVHTQISDLHYRVLERVENKHSVSYELSQPIHVNRLRPFSPLDDGKPSVPNQPPPPKSRWITPQAPVVGDMVVVHTEAEWDDKPFDVARVLQVLREGRTTRFVVHWFGNMQDAVTGAQHPCYVDRRDNKRVYKRQDSKAAQFSPWTSETTRTKITQENLLLVGVKLTRAGKLSAEDLDKLQACPHIQWHLPVTEPPSFFD